MAKFLDYAGLERYNNKVSASIDDVYAKIGEEKQAVIQQLMPAINKADLTGAGETIPSGTDLNTVLDEGKHSAPYAAISNSLTHCPVRDEGFEMYVFQHGINGYVWQLIVANDGRSLYTRLTDGSDTAWQGLTPVRIACHSGELSAAAWGDHYYQDLDVSSYIPSGRYVYAVTPGQMTGGGVLQLCLQDEHTVRVLNDKNFSGAQVQFYLTVF